MPVYHRFHVVKTVFRHQHVSCQAKPIFLTVDASNVCNDVKYVGSTHDNHKVFPSPHNSISIPKHLSCLDDILKSDSHRPKKSCVICLIESPLKLMKNAFYFILKVLFVLKMFKFLSRLFGHVGKTA